MNNKFTNAIIVLLLMFGVFACQKESPVLLPDELPKTADFDNEVALEWMQFYLEIERYTPGYLPPVSARASAYICLAAYQAVVPGMAESYNSLQSTFPAMKLPEAESGQEYHWPTALHAAYSSIFSAFFPTAPASMQQKLFALKQKFNIEFGQTVPADVYKRSSDFGTAVANAVYNWSKTDASGHEAYLHNTDPSYQPPNFAGSWQPTYPDYSQALLPYWGQVRTFVASSDDNAPQPLPFSTDPTSQIYVQAKEVKNLVNLIKGGQNYEDRWIANFWSDDCPILTFTPSGRWIAVTNQLISTKKSSLDEAVYAYAKVCMALSDSGVRCWNEKYKYNYLRPVDYIRQMMGDTEWNTVMCPDGSGNYFTPPFPAYPSGHATFGAAAAEVLTDVFGISTAMTDRCHEGRTEFISTPRSFQSFYEMAEENAYSRIPLGVHFRMDAEAGLKLGYQIGRKVNRLPWKK